MRLPSRLRRIRDGLVVSLIQRNGVTVPDIAAIFGISERTVRAIKRLDDLRYKSSKLKGKSWPDHWLD